MSYLFQEKFLISRRKGGTQEQKRVLILEPEDYLREIYLRLLREQGLTASGSASAEALIQHALLFHPHAMLLNLDHFSSTALAGWMLRKLKGHLPQLLIITIAQSADSASLKGLMAEGVAGHVNRKLSRPQDIITVIRSVLDY